jgi:hypothetical protein
MVFYSSVSEDGPKYPVRYCSRKCIAEARWEGRKPKVDRELLRRLYLANWTFAALAERLHLNRGRIRAELKSMGIPIRSHTSVRTCQHPGCKLSPEKRFHQRKDKSFITTDGQPKTAASMIP